MSVFTSLFVVVLLVVGGTFPALTAADKYQRGPFTAEQALPAPEWQISEWMGGPGSKLEDLRGQVVIVDFFQLWCPGCNSFSIPLMEQWETDFADEISSGKLTLISIHTVFEGHDYQNNTRLKAFIKEKGMDHPVGVDKYSLDERLPDTMILYQTRGTPEMAFIDKAGRLRFQKFGYFDADWAAGYIRELIAEEG